MDGNRTGVHRTSWYCGAKMKNSVVYIQFLPLCPCYCILQSVLQRLWLAADEWKSLPMSRKSNSLPRWDCCVNVKCKILVLVISVLNVENPLNSLSQILMPLINQYFKNHCLYFLSTPAKVLGSGGHSSNKEKEMIARWCLCFIDMTQKYIYLYIFFSNIMFLLLWAFDFFLSFLLLPFPFFHFVVSSVKCLLWWGTEFLSLVRWQTCSTTLSESFLSLLFLCVFLYFVSCNAPFCHPG